MESRDVALFSLSAFSLMRLMSRVPAERRPGRVLDRNPESSKARREAAPRGGRGRSAEGRWLTGDGCRDDLENRRSNYAAAGVGILQLQPANQGRARAEPAEPAERCPPLCCC